jgi:hypothetical protein
LVEQLIRNQQVTSSSLVAGSKSPCKIFREQNAAVVQAAATVG